MVSTSVNMMSTAKEATALTERLERLSEDAACDCVPEYRNQAGKIRDSADFARTLQTVKALSDENRLLAMGLLRKNGELCACEIQAATGLSHPTVSHHMSVLAEAGLVDSRRQGKWLYYRAKGRPRVEIP